MSSSALMATSARAAEPVPQTVCSNGWSNQLGKTRDVRIDESSSRGRLGAAAEASPKAHGRWHGRDFGRAASSYRGCGGLTDGAG